MGCKVIFASGYYDDIDLSAKQLSCDVLLQDSGGAYYNPQFITLERLHSEFDENKVCYLEECLVILREISIETILKSVPELYKWMFWKYWQPVSNDDLVTYFYPQEEWAIFIVEV